MEKSKTLRNVLSALTISFLILTFHVKKYEYFTFDLNIARGVQSFNPPWFDFLMVLISKLGDYSGGSLIILLFICLAIFLRRKREALMIFISTASGTLISQTLKYLVGRPRPSSSLINVVGHFGKSDSFPSGHVMFYVSLYGFLLFLTFSMFRKKIYIRNFLIAVFSSLIILAGVSRIYLGAHWFSDVLGGYLVGFIWLLIVIHFYNLSSPEPQK